MPVRLSSFNRNQAKTGGKGANESAEGEIGIKKRNSSDRRAGHPAVDRSTEQQQPGNE